VEPGIGPVSPITSEKNDPEEGAQYPAQSRIYYYKCGLKRLGHYRTIDRVFFLRTFNSQRGRVT